ncbi:MAG: nucleotidyltransferase domain-containing protein [Dehalococcoidia bacterium]
MKRDVALARIREHLPELGRFEVETLELFGSTARGSARRGSDVDVMATFRRPPTLREFMGLKFALEEWLGVPVDLVDRAAIQEGWRSLIERDAILVA